MAWDPEAARRCARLLARSLEQAAPEARKVLVDNRGQGMEWAPAEGFELVAGDNAAREFSGWQRAVEHVAGLGPPEVWLLTNDRLEADPAALELLHGGTLDAVSATGSLAGRINGYPKASRAFGLEVDSWARSNFLVVADEAMRRLGSLITIGEDQLSVVIPAARGGRDRLLAAGEALDEHYAAYVTEWLTGDGSALPEHWYRAMPATEAAWGELRAKAQCVLNEQLLSARARSVGIPVVPLEVASGLGGLERTDPAFRALARAIRARPLQAPSLLDGLLGRLLFALGGVLAAVRRGIARPLRDNTGPPSEARVVQPE